MAATSTSPWPPANDLTTNVVPRSRAVWSVSASIRIQAPAALVFDVVRDASRYGEWNQFCPKVDISTQPPTATGCDKLSAGTNFFFNVIMNDKKPDSTYATALRISDYSTPDEQSSYIPEDVLNNDGSFHPDLSKVYRIAWISTGPMSYLLATERFHEIIVLGENECEVRTWENQSGVMSHVVRWMYLKVLQGKFQMWVSDLKKYSEAKAKA